LKVENLKRGEIEEVGAAARVIFSGQAGALYAFGYRHDRGKEEEANEAGFPGVANRQNLRDDNACVENDIHAAAWRSRIWVIQEVVSAREAMILCR
jgi:hypothetical protein